MIFDMKTIPTAAEMEAGGPDLATRCSALVGSLPPEESLRRAIHLVGSAPSSELTSSVAGLLGALAIVSERGASGVVEIAFARGRFDVLWGMDGQCNLAIGDGALIALTSGRCNIAIGTDALKNVTSESGLLEII